MMQYQLCLIKAPSHVITQIMGIFKPLTIKGAHVAPSTGKSRGASPSRSRSSLKGLTPATRMGGRPSPVNSLKVYIMFLFPFFTICYLLSAIHICYHYVAGIYMIDKQKNRGYSST